MKLPWAAARALTPEEYRDYCKQVITDCQHCSIRAADYQQSLLDFPLLMMPGEWPKLARLSEELSREVATAEREVLHRPELFRSLGLRTGVAEVLSSCRAKIRPKGFARVMRFDFYFTEEGWRFSEANPDAPGGYVEAYGLTRAMATYYPGFSPPPNPAASYADAIHRYAGKGAMIAFFQAGVRAAAWSSEFIQNEVKKRGMRGILVNPRHLVWKSNFAQVLTPSGTVRPNVLIRMLVADWLPNLGRRALWVPWFCGSKTPMSNPGFSIVVESKRLPLFFKELDTPMSTYLAFSPESRSPIEISAAAQNQWVFKPTFGYGGHGIGIAGVTKKGAFTEIANVARRNPLNWVAQRRFRSVSVPTERGPGHVCLGIYTFDGVTAGAFARIKGKPLIDGHAPSIPILIPEGDMGMQVRKSNTWAGEKFNSE